MPSSPPPSPPRRQAGGREEAATANTSGNVCGLLEAWQTPSLQCPTCRQGALSPVFGGKTRPRPPGSFRRVPDTGLNCCRSSVPFGAAAGGDLEATGLAPVSALPRLHPACQGRPRPPELAEAHEKRGRGAGGCAQEDAGALCPAHLPGENWPEQRLLGAAPAFLSLHS